MLIIVLQSKWALAPHNGEDDADTDVSASPVLHPSGSLVTSLDRRKLRACTDPAARATVLLRQVEASLKQCSQEDGSIPLAALQGYV